MFVTVLQVDQTWKNTSHKKTYLRLAETLVSRPKEYRIFVIKLERAHGGCLGIRRLKGVEDCDMPGGVVKQALIPEFPN